MCTRYYIDSENPDLYTYVDAAERSSIARTFVELGYPLKREGEIRPSDVAPVIATARSRRKAIFPMQWGYTMTGASGDKVSLLLNARSETAARRSSDHMALWAVPHGAGTAAFRGAHPGAIGKRIANPRPHAPHAPGASHRCMDRSKYKS